MPRKQTRHGDDETADAAELLGTREKIEEIIISRRDRRKASWLKRRKENAERRALASQGAGEAEGQFKLWDSVPQNAASPPRRFVSEVQQAEVASPHTLTRERSNNDAGGQASRPQPPAKPRIARPTSADSFFVGGALSPGALRAHCATIVSAKTPGQILQSVKHVRAALAADRSEEPLLVRHG